MKLTTTLTALILSISSFTGIANATQSEISPTAEPTLEAQDAAIAAVNNIVWHDWIDGCGYWRRTYSEYNYCGHLVNRWTVYL
jgi:hypothetical protein